MTARHHRASPRRAGCQASTGSGHAIELIPELHERFSTLKHRHDGRPRHLNEAS